MQVLPMRSGPFAFRYQGNGATPAKYIDTIRKAIDCAKTLPLTIFIKQEGQHTLTGQRAANFRRDLEATYDFN